MVSIILISIGMRGGIMKKTDCSKFQETVDENLIRHRSVLDITSKLQEANARLNRAIAKAATSCGCIKINSELMEIPAEISSYHELKNFMDNHLDGKLCPSCKETIESEMGRSLFYFFALLNVFDMDFNDIIEKEQERMDTFGIYRLS
jgi:hypothetical protein